MVKYSSYFLMNIFSYFVAPDRSSLGSGRPFMEIMQSEKVSYLKRTENAYGFSKKYKMH